MNRSRTSSVANNSNNDFWSILIDDYDYVKSTNTPKAVVKAPVTYAYNGWCRWT